MSFVRFRILQILEAGLMERWQSKWYPIGSKCTGLERTTSQTNISLAQAQGAFYILGIGLVIASVCLVTERLNTLRKRTKQTPAVAKDPDKDRVTYVGTMAYRRPVPTVSGRTETNHKPQFALAFDVSKGHGYTYNEYHESSTDDAPRYVDDEAKEKKKKSFSCPLLFGCCDKPAEEDDHSMPNGIAIGAVNLRSAFSDTIWTKRPRGGHRAETENSVRVHENGVGHMSTDAHSGFHFGGGQSNGHAVANGSARTERFTFESVREARQGASKRKDAETGELSTSDDTVFSIRL